MTDSRWTRAKEIVDAAAELDPADRDAYVRQACAGDEELREEVATLLDALADTDSQFLRAPTAVGTHPGPESAPAFARISDDFELVRRIGAGAFGVVYAAHQRSLDRLVAVKVFSQPLVADPKLLERFKREAKAVAKIDHPHVVRVLTVGEREDVHWFAMDYVDGHDLGAELELKREPPTDSQPILPARSDREYVRTVTKLIADAAEGLQCAHDHGIVHRDIKPQNLLLARDGQVRLADFGLARDGSLGRITQSREIAGTPTYMSPEQADAVAHKIDHRTDIYSLGVVLYEALSLVRPFEAASIEATLNRIRTEEAVPLRRQVRAIPTDLATVCHTAMAKRPDDRYSTAGDFAEDLRRFLAFAPIVARPPSPVQRLRRWIAAHRVASLIGLTVVVASVAAFQVAGAVAARRKIESWRERVAGALGLSSWVGAEDRVADARRALIEARTEGSLPTSLAPEARALEERIETFRARQLEALSGRLRQAKGAPVSATNSDGFRREADLSALLRTLVDANRARTALWDDAELEDLASIESLFPEVEIDWSPRQQERRESVRVLAAPIDSQADRVGDARLLSTGLPLRAALPPGEWRITVHAPGYGFSEYDRDLRIDNRTYTIRAFVRPTAEATMGLVRVAGTRLVLDQPREIGCCQLTDSVNVDEFWAAEAEVSNREYLDFWRAGGSSLEAAPKFWTSVGFDGEPTSLPGVTSDNVERWLTLPAVGMSFYDMQTFAEWHGWRLPRHVEMEYLLRGAGMRREPPEGIQANVQGAPSSGPRLLENRYEQYVQLAMPVREPGYRQAPHGLFHIYGNVAELTASKVIEAQRNTWVATPFLHVQMGGAWDAERDLADLYDHVAAGIDEPYVSPDRGFRCIRSAEPTPGEETRRR